MKGKRIAAFAVLSVFLTAALTVSLAAQKKAKTEARVFIPKDVKKVLESGLLTKQPCLNIPFAVTDHLFLPAGGSFHNILRLEIKNKDLGFAPAAQEPEKTPEGSAAPAAEMRAVFNLFIQYREISGGLPGMVAKEIYIPCDQNADAAGYDPEKTELYFVGYPLSPGKYMAALALTTTDLKKIGTQYFEFSTPDPAVFVDRLETTPVFTVKNIERMEAPENRTILHKDHFTYSILKIWPNIGNVVGFQDNLDIFYFVFGARPNAEQKYDLETEMEVKKDEESVLRFAPTVMESPLVSLPLPLKRTLITQSEAGETREEKDLEPGSYVLVIKILDKNSGNTVTKTVPFTVTPPAL
ncbi:MAG: hypothetical protein JW747_10285 [Candidatus Aminicenantes bacterium]|nr:hypothetical protein [Candidatus Aminicenantes bacterium]